MDRKPIAVKAITISIYIFIALLPVGLCERTYAQAHPTVPSSPVQSGIAKTIPGSRCGKGKVQLHASAHNPVDTIKWYSHLAGGAPIGTGTSWTTPVIASSTTYYVSASRRGHSSERKALKATINTLPAIPVISPKGTAAFCEGSSVKLSIAAPANGITWSTGATTTSIRATATGIYSVHVSSASGCSATSAATAVTVTKIPRIVSITQGENCGHGQALLMAKADAGTLKWYATKTGNESVSTGGMYFTPYYITSGTRTFYVDATDKGCTSDRMSVPANIKPRPSITSTTDASCSGAGTLQLKAESNTGVIKWYAMEVGGVPLATDNAFVTPKLSTSTVYYAEASLDGCSSERMGVTADVNSSSSNTAGPMTASTDHAPKASVNINPNPSKGKFTITSSADMIYIVNNETKKTVAEGKFNSDNNHTLQLKHFDKGVYHFIGYNKMALVKENIIVEK